METLLKFKQLNRKISNELTLTDKEYTRETDKILSYLLNKKKINPKVFYSIKKNPELGSYIKHAVMHADWKFDKTKKVKLGTWRIKCVLWEIYRICIQFDKCYNSDMLNFTDLEDENTNIAELIEAKKTEEGPEYDKIYYSIIELAKEVLDEYSLKIFMDYYKNGENISSISRKNEVSYTKIKSVLDKSVDKVRREFAE